jgi:hypothetical protein
VIGSLRRWRFCLVLTGLMALSAPALAQEFFLLGGVQKTKSLDEQTYSWLFDYQHDISEHFYATFSWQNEGHVTDHHRDGHGLQAWARWVSPARAFTFSAGIGPYRYYDTTTGSNGNSTDDHGYGVIYSAAAHWYINNPWVMQVRYNHVQANQSFNTDTLQIGVGYQFEYSKTRGPVVPVPTYGFTSDKRSDFTVMAGHSIVNNFQSPKGVAWGLEYRYRLTPFVDFTASFIDEGDADVVKRRGATAQLWIMREFNEHRASIGLGLGPYFTRDEELAGSENKTLGLLTMTGSYRWNDTWSLRGYWNRTVTDNGRDSDVILLGLGYRF